MEKTQSVFAESGYRLSTNLDHKEDDQKNRRCSEHKAQSAKDPVSPSLSPRPRLPGLATTTSGGLGCEIGWGA
jgi:hypothetical protein